MADTQIDELRLDITVEDKTSGESSGKKVKNLATAISLLNKNLQAFDNAKFTKVFDNMSKGLDPFVKKIESVSSALASLATIVSKGGLDKAVKEVTDKVPELKTETTSDSGLKSEPMQAVQGQAEEISESIEDADDSLRDIDNRFDLLVAKGREIEKGLEKTKLTNKQILSLVSQRLTVEEGLERIAKNEEKAQIEAEAAKQQAEAAEQAQKFRDTIVDVTSPLELTKIQLEKVQASLKENGLTENQYLTLKKQELQLQKKINNEENGGKEDKKKKPLGQLLKSFSRIAMYRAIRRTIQEITQAFTEGIGGLARYNSEVNQSMSKITSNFAQVKASISVALYQPLIAIEPIITAVSQSIVHLSNGLSFLFAKLRGANTYMKINTQYLKDYKSALDGTLLSFDTFETLGKGQGINYSQMFEEVETAGSSFANELGNVKNILLEIAGILSAIAGYKIAKWIANGGIKKLIDGLGGINKKIKDISTAGLIAGATFSFITSIINLIDVIKNWDSQSLVTQITAATAAAAGLAAVVFSILAAIPAIGHTAVFKALSIGLTAAGTLMGVVSAMKFADGGMMNTKSFNGAGTMYAIAGESGAEVVATGSAGTGVLNVDQFADAMVSALVRYGAARDTSNGTTIVLDGNKVGQLVASNVGFRNEANRRNAGLNWK